MLTFGPGLKKITREPSTRSAEMGSRNLDALIKDIGHAEYQGREGNPRGEK
jgi:hypothetical protein